MSRSSIKALFVGCLVVPLLLSWTPSTSFCGNPTTYLVHIQRMPSNGVDGLWPESTSVLVSGTNPSGHHSLPHLHRGNGSNGDMIQFVLDDTAKKCQVVFAMSPLALKPQDDPMDTITVYSVGNGVNETYVISKKTQIPKGGYCLYFFRIEGNSDCNKPYNTCWLGDPPGTTIVEPCWKSIPKATIFQIGPGMDISD